VRCGGKSHHLAAESNRKNLGAIQPCSTVEHAI
jgi:hypothetical protein